MEVFEAIFNFINWFFLIEIPIGDYAFSVWGGVLFFGAIAVMWKFLEFFFDV